MGLKITDAFRKVEEIMPIARLAAEHFEQHRQPLRIAIDEPYWWFNNVTAEQEIFIRRTQPAYNREKSLFYRICRLLTLNIQPIFVFDGPGVPEKIRWKGKRGVPERPELLKQVLECFGIPYQLAPAEAEAECAKLQKLGIVDAVWSGDADALMFGCDLLISDHGITKQHGDQNRSKGHTQKSRTHVQIIRAQKMKEELALDCEGLVLFAMLAGGDYHPGLSDCGTGLALRVVQKGTLARELCECQSHLDCNKWRTKLTAFLHTRPSARRVVVPPLDFPQYSVLKQYCRRAVTQGHLLSKLRLDLAASRPFQERELLQVTSSRFNIWGKLYMDRVGPILLTRALVQKDNASLKTFYRGSNSRRNAKVARLKSWICVQFNMPLVSALSKLRLCNAKTSKMEVSRACGQTEETHLLNRPTLLNVIIFRRSCFNM